MDALVGQVVLGEHRLDRLLRQDGALALFEATSTVDGGLYTVIVAPQVRVETAATALEAAVDRAGRHAVGVKGVVSLLRGSTLAGPDRSWLVAVRRGGADPEPLPGRLPIAEAVRLLTPLAEALAAIHDQGLVHGALCPLTVGRRNGELTLDFFGLGAAAEVACGARGSRDLLALPYQPPELRGERPSSPGPWTDIAALALLALDLITGTRGLFAEGRVPPLDAHGLIVSPQVTDLFQRTLDPSPRARPLDPRVFLRELLAGASAPLPPPSSSVPAPVPSAAPPVPDAAPSAPAPRPSASRPSAPAPDPSAHPELPDTEAIQEARQRRLLGVVFGAGLLLLLGGSVAAALLSLRQRPAPATPATPATAHASVSPPSSSSAVAPPDSPRMPLPRSRGPATFPADTTALLPIPADAAVWGERNALVTLVLFADLTCPFTARALAALPALAARYGEELRIVWKFYPPPGDADAQRASAAAAQVWSTGGADIFWSFVGLAAGQKLDEAGLERVAVEAGLGAGSLAGKLGKAPPIVEQDITLGRRLGVRGTPVSFLNGRRMDGLQPPERLIKVIDHELRRTKALLKGGTTPEQLYAQRVTTNITTSEGEKLSP